MANIESSILGKIVRIQWANPKHDWPYFFVRDVDPKKGLVLLRGVDYPDGTAKHDGSFVSASAVEIKNLEIIR